MTRTETVDLGAGLPPPPIAADSGLIKEVRVYGELYDEELKRFAKTANVHGANLTAMDEGALKTLNNLSTVDSTRG